jgi:dTDP-4-dehydrorhamnose reductase
VDRAEDEPDLAFRLNAEGVENIARTANALHAKIVHISSDYVFNGSQTRPYTEEDLPSPLGIYGSSKLEGERRLQAITDRHYIVRTAWLYSSHGANFLLSILRQFRSRNKVRVVADQRGSPTYARDLAITLLHIIRSGVEYYGTYHYTNSGDATWYDFANLIRDLGEKKGLIDPEVPIQPISTMEYPLRARRPAYSCLSKDKIRKVFGITPRPWQEALDDCMERLKKQLCEG